MAPTTSAPARPSPRRRRARPAGSALSGSPITRSASDPHVLERDLRGALTVLGRVAAAREPGRRRIDEEEADPVAVAPRAGGAGRHEDRVGAVAVQDDAFLAVQNESRRRRAARGRRDVEQVVARLPLRVREGERMLSGRHPGQVLRLSAPRCRRAAATRRRERPSRGKARGRASGRRPPSPSWSRPARRRSRHAPPRRAARAGRAPRRRSRAPGSSPQAPRR